jgi:DNA polymerase-3 subunit gamma/tau
MNIKTDLRPAEFGEMVGMGKELTALLARCQAGKIPHSVLLTGPTGCGKTTTARILANLAKLAHGSAEVSEINAANVNGVEGARDIAELVAVRPLMGARVFILDECHRLSKEAQDILLKPVEEPPAWCYIILCTTEPGKLSKTLAGRCFHVKFTELTTEDAVLELVTRALKAMKAKANAKELTQALMGRGVLAPRAILDAVEMFVYTGELKASTVERVTLFDAVRGYYNGNMRVVFEFLQEADTTEIVNWQFTAANYGASIVKRNGGNTAGKDAARKVLNIVEGYPDEAVLRAAWIVARLVS